MNPPRLLRPERLRAIEKPFAWIPYRLLQEDIFACLTDRSKLLYIFLCLVADRQGISFYGDQRIQSYFQLTQTDINLAKKELVQKDLIAYDGRCYQVLSLPAVDQRFPRDNHPASEAKSGKPEHVGDILKHFMSPAQ